VIALISCQRFNCWCSGYGDHAAAPPNVHSDAAVRDPEVQSRAVLALWKSQSLEQVLNKVVDGLFGAMQGFLQPPGPVGSRALVFDVPRAFLAGDIQECPFEPQEHKPPRFFRSDNPVIYLFPGLFEGGFSFFL